MPLLTCKCTATNWYHSGADEIGGPDQQTIMQNGYPVSTRFTCTPWMAFSKTRPKLTKRQINRHWVVCQRPAISNTRMLTAMAKLTPKTAALFQVSTLSLNTRTPWVPPGVILMPAYSYTDHTVINCTCTNGVLILLRKVPCQLPIG
jgi:hypothetical protein